MYATRAVFCAILLASAGVLPAQTGVPDSILVRAIQEKVTAREHSTISAERVRFSDESSKIVPGLRYRWADYSPWDNGVTLHFYAAGASRLSEARLVRDAADWGAMVGAWYPRTGTEAKDACAEMFRVARSDAGPGWDRYVLYEHPASLPPMEPEEAEYLRRHMVRRSRARALGAPARWEVEIWVVSGGWNGTGHRVRCTLPRTGVAPAPRFSAEIVSTVQVPPNRRLM